MANHTDMSHTHQDCDVATDIQPQGSITVHDEVESEVEMREVLRMVAQALNNVGEAAEAKEGIFIHSLNFMLERRKGR